MYTLAANDTIYGGASGTPDLTITLFGMELNGTTETYKVLYQGVLGSSVVQLYAATANGPTFIKTITVVNTDLANAYTFQLFRGGSAAANAITPLFNLAAGGSAIYEDGLGWSISTIGAGTTLLNDIHTGYSEYQAIANPAAPSAGNIRVYGRTISGRTVVKWMPPSGVDNPMQAALYGNNIIMYYPTSGTNGGTATLGTIGASWTAGGTVSHPTPSAGVSTQMRRTRYANVVTTTNQTLGIVSIAAGLPSFWRGNAAGLGGFFFFARYTVELWPAATCRIFVGLQDSTTAQVTLDIASMTGNFCAFAHDTTDGGTQMWFITRDNATTNKVSITLANAIAAGEAYDFYIYAKPNDSTIYFRMDRINDGTTIVDSSTGSNLPTNTAFMGPAVTMSNGTANTTATTVAPGINRVYVESDH